MLPPNWQPPDADHERRPERFWRLLPPGLDPAHYSLIWWGPILLGLCVGLQIATSLFMLLGPGQPPDPATLTSYGRVLMRPEHDLSVYILSIALTLALIIGAVWLWKRTLLAHADDALSWARASSVQLGIIGLLSGVAYLGVLAVHYPVLDTGQRTRSEHMDGLALFVTPLAALLCAVLELRSGSAREELPTSRGAQRAQRMRCWLNFLTPALVLLLVFVPVGAWDYLAGQTLLQDTLNHWNAWAMEPAVQFLHGRALHTDAYALYGMGWPTLFVSLRHVLPLTYGNMIGLTTLFGCLYYMGLFLLLRLLLRNSLWATLGVLLVLIVQLFSGLGPSPGEVNWSWPSQTAARWPADVGFFLALLMYQRSGRPWWLALAGAACGLGIFFVLDTGGFLLVTFGIFWVGSALLPREQQRAVGRARYMGPLIFLGALLAVALPAALYASRGTLLHDTFWSGMFENIRVEVLAGYFLVPIAEVDSTTMILFLAMMSVCVIGVALPALRWLHGVLTRDDVFLATWSAYAMAVLTYFVGRSVAGNLYHVMPPCVLLVILLWRGWVALGERARRSWIPAVSTATLLVLLLTKAEFAAYPGVLQAVCAGSPHGGLCLLTNPQDMCGLPDNSAQFIKEFNDVSNAIRQLHAGDTDVAIFDNLDATFYYASGAAPWTRYGGLYRVLLTENAMGQIVEKLKADHPRYVVMRDPQNRQQIVLSDNHAMWVRLYGQNWLRLYQVVHEKYTPMQQVGSYEIWSYPQ